MKRTFFWKVFGGHVVLLLSFAALFLLFSYGTIRRSYVETLVQDLERLGRALDGEVIGFLETGGLPALEARLVGLGRRIGTRLTVVSAEGVVLADSDRDPGTMESHRFRPEVYEALAGRTGHSVRHSDTIGKAMLYVALPLERNGRVEAALRLSLLVKDIDALLGGLKGHLAAAALLILALSLLAAFLFSRRLSRPVQELIQASRRVSAGDLAVRVRPRGGGEWRDMGRSFNLMTEKIQTLFADLTRKKDELDKIMAGMEEGLLVLDKNGRIVLSNAAAAALIGQEKIEGRFYWEAVRATPFVELVRRVASDKRGSLAEVVFGDKSILCRASYLPSEDGLVMTLLDVTEMQNLARIKRDFVVNVSHELRTPLTAIRGYAETLEAEVDEKHRPYAGIILKHSDRLIKIVRDLLALAVLEEKRVALQAEEVNLADIAANVVRIFEPKAKQKNLDLGLTADPDLPVIRADGYRLEQMLVNLVENALNYTEKGGVAIALKRGGDAVVIEVGDTGLGIPEEDRDRIFERFYVVDKSRSRQLGGTGLGLSIVKHIVSLHGGKIRLRSTPGAGSTFTVSLPVRQP